jgi:hypothetical protein
VSDAEPPHRLDPEAASAQLRQREAPQDTPPDRPQPVLDVRPYRWAIGIFGLLLLIAFSIYQVSSHGLASPGVPPGSRLHLFSAPLAASNLNGDANLTPPCTEAAHDPRALNLCLLAREGPLVLAFFSTGSAACEQQVTALQAVAARYPHGPVHFAAVAVRTEHAAARAAVRAHRWSIPVAYDRDGAVGGLYDTEICPIVELARTGGVVDQRLIGNHWSSADALDVRVRELLAR